MAKTCTITIAQIEVFSIHQRPGTAYRRYTVVSGDTGQHYTLLQMIATKRVMSCDCPARKFGHGQPCKHMRELSGLVAPETVTAQTSDLEVEFGKHRDIYPEAYMASIA